MKMATKMILWFFVSCAIAVVCSGHTYSWAACPKVAVQKDFSMDKFLGEWYVIARFNPISTCVKINVGKSADDIYFMNETSRPYGLNILFEKHYRRGRKLNVLSDKTDSIFRVQPKSLFGLRTFGILDTDYENYAVVWGCDPLLLGSVQNLDILSRQPQMDEKLLNHTIDASKEMGIYVEPINFVDQTWCSDEDRDEWKDSGVNNMFVEEQ